MQRDRMTCPRSQLVSGTVGIPAQVCLMPKPAGLRGLDTALAPEQVFEEPGGRQALNSWKVIQDRPAQPC